MLARGFAGSRVRPTGKLPREAHVAAMAAAQLWMDTLNYNAHGTGTDVLWASLPAVTLSGDKQASMAFRSMACAVGVCDPGASTRREYADLAAALLAVRSAVLS